MKIPYLDLSINSEQKRGRILSQIEKVLMHGRLIEGPEVAAFEQAVANYCGAHSAIGVSSGSGSLYLALRALGIGPGDEVIVPCVSWIATAHAAKLVGAEVVFADVKEDLNIDLESVKRLKSNKTKAIVAVHFMGIPAAMSELKDYTRKHGLFLIEDASQAFGTLYKGEKVGTIGDVGCFSLNPMKTLAALGEAGVIVTSNAELDKRIKILRYCGVEKKVLSKEASLNFRMDTIVAAALIIELEQIDEVIDRREQIAKYYQQHLPASAKGIIASERASYYGFLVKVDQRDDLKDFLERQGIETKIKHLPLMSDQPAYLDCRSETVCAKRIMSKALCLPNHQNLMEEELDYICSKVNEFYGKC